MKVLLNSLFVWLGVFSLNTVAADLNNNQPKLILQITVDQLRGDLPDKFMKNMGEGGFRYLKKNAIWYSNAHYGHSNTETVVGHTTLATGADPAEHGMVSNVWYDRESDRLAYNVEDSRYHILSEGADVDKSSEVDASQKLASTDGRSPANIMVSTFSDELSFHTNGQAKIFAVSVKDRGAVTLAGHAGKAFWFSKASGEFITSNYYYDKYPQWVSDWNRAQKNRAYENQAWSLQKDKSLYLYANQDDQSWEVDVAGFGRTFPHHYGAADNKHFNNFLTFSPAGDELTLSFAKTIIKHEKLGQNSVTDFLSISFSSTDYVGHLFGPSSLEAEDNMLRLDRTLASLFEYVDEHVGLNNTLIILSADHGGPDAPGNMREFGVDAGYVALAKLNNSSSFDKLKKRFGVGEELIKTYFPPYVYLDRELIKRKGLNLLEVEQAVANEIIKIDGVASAISSTEIRMNQLPDTFLNRKAIRNYNPQRSGDILVLFKPFYFVNDFHGEITAANHGGPWDYDTFVPVIFAGKNIKGQRISRKVEPKDIAPTLSAFLDIKSPSGSSGNVLPEVVRFKCADNDKNCMPVDDLQMACHKRPDLCDSQKKRFSAYQPNYAIYKSTEGDDGSLEMHFSFKYLLTEPHCVPKGELDLSCLLNYKKRDEVFFSYTGEFDFYFYRTSRQSQPVINRIHNPAFHYRTHFDTSDSEGGVSIEWFNIALEHRSNGQTVPAKGSPYEERAREAYATGDIAYFDKISHSANYISFEAKFNAGNNKKDNKKCRRSFSCVNFWLSVKEYILQDYEESDVNWGPRDDEGVSIEDYDRAKFIISNEFSINNTDLNLTLEWTVGDELLDTDSFDLSLMFAVNFGNRFRLPFYIRGHYGPMNTLSDYTREQNSIGVGLLFR